MSTPATESLADKLSRRGQEAKQSALTAIEGLTQIAERLEMSMTVDDLAHIHGNLGSHQFKILVMGRFKNGKSTLLNAILGGTSSPVDLGGQAGPMVVDDLPATAILTCVRYAPTPKVIAYDFDNNPEEWSLERYMRESTQEADPDETRRKFERIQVFELHYPAELCKAGVMVYDSPGLDDHPERTVITRQAARECDAAIVVYRSDTLMGQGEMQDASEVLSDGATLFSVINLWDGRTVDDRLLRFVWSRSAGAEGIPYAGPQGLTDRRFFFIDGRRASNSRYGRSPGDPDGIRLSGMAAFEERLFDFLAHDRAQVHVAKFARQAYLCSDTVEKHVAQRRQAAQMDRESLNIAFQEIQPQLAAIRTRPVDLARTLEKFTADGIAVVVAGFQQAIADIRRDLPQELAGYELGSRFGAVDLLKQKKLQRQAGEFVEKFVTDRIEAWGRTEVSRVLEPLLERLYLELEREVGEIEQDFSRLHQHLTGWQVDPIVAGKVATVSMFERVVASATGLFLGDLSAAFTGGAGGWRGAAGGIAGAFGSAFVLGLMGIAATSIVALPITLIAAAAVGLGAGSLGFVDRLKKAVVKECDPQIAQLGERGLPAIEAKVSAGFQAIAVTITDEVAALIEQEERNITLMVEENQRDRSERDRILADLAQTAVTVAEYRLALKEATTIARQVTGA